ncbi:MAG: hypothetical protein HYX43_09195 [Burkholderiales bacterium]|nr:hypothetical protein [Burkholderiales bacterium]
MFKFLKNSGSKTPAATATAPESAFRDSVSSLTGVRRELIKTAFRDALRLQGIPYEWLSCEVITVAPTQGEAPLQIQLTLMQWQETFLRYGPAMEHVLQREIERLDPSTERSQYSIVWRFSPDCGCPFKVMPPPRIWSHAQPQTQAPAQAPAGVPKVEPHDLLDRRRTPRAPNSDNAYQPTQLTKL